MVDEFLDRDLFGEFLHAAEMVAVIVRQDQMVDLGETRIAHRVHDAAGITHRAIGVARIDKNGFA